MKLHYFVYIIILLILNILSITFYLIYFSQQQWLSLI